MLVCLTVSLSVYVCASIFIVCIVYLPQMAVYSLSLASSLCLVPRQVSSRDRDAAPFTNRTYSIVANSSSSNIFDIDLDTGMISVKNSSSAADELDYDTGSNTFALFVEVSDGVQ